MAARPEDFDAEEPEVAEYDAVRGRQRHRELVPGKVLYYLLHELLEVGQELLNGHHDCIFALVVDGIAGTGGNLNGFLFKGGGCSMICWIGFVFNVFVDSVLFYNVDQQL